MANPRAALFCPRNSIPSLATKYKVYLNIGADKGLKPGDYLRATRTYSYTYHDPEAGMSLKASERKIRR